MHRQHLIHRSVNWFITYYKGSMQLKPLITSRSDSASLIDQSISRTRKQSTEQSIMIPPTPSQVLINQSIDQFISPKSRNILLRAHSTSMFTQPNESFNQSINQSIYSTYPYQQVSSPQSRLVFSPLNNQSIDRSVDQYDSIPNHVYAALILTATVLLMLIAAGNQM